MNTPVIPGAAGGPDMDETDEGLTAFRVGGMVSQSDIDKYKIRYGTTLGSNYVAEQTGWDGLTKTQEVQQQESREERQFEDELEENERLYQQSMQALQEEDDRLTNEINEMKSKTGHYQGKAIFRDPKTGKFIDEDGNELDEKGQQAMQQAAANGQNFEDNDTYRQKKQRKEAVEQTIRDKGVDHASAVAAATTANANGDPAAAAAILKTENQTLLNDQAVQQKNREIVVAHVDASAKEVVSGVVTNEVGNNIDDILDGTQTASPSSTQSNAIKMPDGRAVYQNAQGNFVSSDGTSLASADAVRASQAEAAGQAAVSQASRTSYASGLDPSQLSSKGAFTVASTAAVPAATIPDIVQENAGSSQRNPVTPSPTAAV